MSVPQILINNGFITQLDREKISDFSERSGLSFVKIALNFGYIVKEEL